MSFSSPWPARSRRTAQRDGLRAAPVARATLVVTLTGTLMAALFATLLAASPARALETASAAVSAAAPGSAAAAAVPEHIRRYIDDARLAGDGQLSWFGIRVYEAHLYAPPQFNVSDPLAQPFVLELTYARKLTGKAIAERSAAEIARLGIGSAEQRTVWQRQMEAIFPDVDTNRRLAGVNVPGRGARFYFDGRPLGHIDDPQFARAFFSIWFDERTSAPKLRASLLQQPARAKGG